MDRRTFMKASAAAGAVAAAGGIGEVALAPAASATPDPNQVAKYKQAVPEIFKPVPDPPDYTQALVIGSGFGGAVTMYRLAQAGVQTTVLERG